MTPLIWPVPGYTAVSSPFGPRPAPLRGASTLHGGIDIACPEDTRIVAPAEGWVQRIWLDRQFGGGLSMVINCGPYRFGFAHLSCELTSNGDYVERGEYIAFSGGTPGSKNAGRSKGPHLHLTVRRILDASLDQGRCGPRFDPLTLDWVDYDGQPVKPEVRR